MKKIILLITLFPGILFSQWIQNYPYPTITNINSVDFIDQNYGWIAGGGGLGNVYRTTNGGTNWTMTDIGALETVLSIKFINQHTGVAMLENNIILRSTNGGLNWKNLNYYNPYTLNVSKLIYHNSKLIGIGSSPYSSSWYGLLVSTNNGLNWSTNMFNFINHTAFKDIYFVNQNTGYITGTNSVIYKTYNGGNNWYRVMPPNINYYNSFKKINFLNESTGFILVEFNDNQVSSHKIIRTTDGGSSWHNSFNGLDTTKKFNSIFIRNGNLILVGNAVYKSSNNGEHWEQVNSNFNTDELKNFATLNDDHIISVNNKDNYYKSTDYGLSWHKLDKKLPVSIVKVKILNENRIIGATGSFVYLSTNKGKDWSTVDNVKASDFCFVTEEIGYSIRSNSNLIHKTINGGSNWVKLQSNNFLQDDSYCSIDFINPVTGIVTGYRYLGNNIYRGVFLFTNTGGVTWYRVSNDNLTSVLNVSMINQDEFYFSMNNEIFKSTDKGQSWHQISNNSNFLNTSLKKMKFYNEHTGYFTLQKDQSPLTSYLLKTTNSGTTWNIWLSFAGPIEDFKEDENNILHVFANVYYLYGLRGFHYQTTANSNHYTVKYSQNSVYFNSFDSKNNFAILVGQNGLVLTNENFTTGINSVSHEIPTEFSLSQNYPNPFNPVTNIKFSLPTTQYTTLKIFDIAGREIATLVNEQLNAGEYNYQFNADEYGLSSGVYFYQLSAGDHSTSSGHGFIQTRKMLMLK